MPPELPDAAKEPPSSTLRIGIAIPVPEPYGAELQRWRKELGDPLADAIPAHITLLPPTDLPAERWAGLVEHLGGVASGQLPFDVRLAGSDTFLPVSRVVFVRVAEGGEGCDKLQAAVRTGPLQQRELTFPYHPHVTVAHELPDENLSRALTQLSSYAASFPVDGFSLYQHGADGVWRPQHRFELGDPAVAGNS